MGVAARAEQGPPQIILGASGVSILRPSFLRVGEEAALRAFLERAFSVDEVETVEIDRARGLSRIRSEPGGARAEFWRRLGRALRLGGGGISAEAVFLEAPGPIKVGRFGETLTTFRARLDDPERLRIGHPLLRRRPDLRFRLEEELAASPEARGFRWDPITAELSVRLASGDRGGERLLGELETAWPRLLEGLDGPPSNRRLATAGAILGVSLAASTVAPGLLPVAVAGVALYGAPNLVAAAKDLRHGRVGLPALYASGLTFFLATRSPLTSALLAALTQLWPWLAKGEVLRSQRELLAPWRRLPNRAWLVLPGGEELETRAAHLAPGDLVALRRGGSVPADGRIERGFVAVAEAAANGAPADKQAGDLLRAGELILDGEAFLRVERTAAESRAAIVAGFLPHGPFTRLPSLEAVERAANRNAKPALALAWGNLAATGVLRRSQGALRPDYVTAPRLSAQLSAQGAYVEALRGGALFLRPGALDRLAEADVVVFDDSAPLIDSPVEFAGVAAQGASRAEVEAYAAAILGLPPPDRRKRLAFWPRGPVRRRAGAVWWEDRAGRRVEIATSAGLAKRGLRPSDSLALEEEAHRPLWVLRDEALIGRVDFRQGAARPARALLDKLRDSPGRALRFVHLAQGDKAEAEALGAALGVDDVLGGLSPEEKARVIRGFGRKAFWIGDGANPALAPVVAASHASLSTAEPSFAEQADALLLTGLEGAVAARAAVQKRRATLSADRRLVYAANLLGVAGAFRAGFGGFQSGLLSNGGTAVVYARHARRLAALRREANLRAWAILREFSI